MKLHSQSENMLPNIEISSKIKKYAHKHNFFASMCPLFQLHLTLAFPCFATNTPLQLFPSDLFRKHNLFNEIVSQLICSQPNQPSLL